jgi:uracil-DNA glycosylase family 4
MNHADEWKQEALAIIASVREYIELQKLRGMRTIPCSFPSVTVRENTLPYNAAKNSAHMPANLKHSQLQAIREDIGDCQRCRLHSSRRNIVFGVGNPDARLVFVGEAPGADEDVQGEPFVGKAGQLLTRIIEAIKLKRSEVYIANVVKCRPPGNRDPQDDEIQTCIPFLKKQLEVIQPRIICTLGRHSTQSLLETREGITALRGRFHELQNGMKVMPTYHPSFLLRYPEKKRETWEDMQKVQKEYLASE